MVEGRGEILKSSILDHAIVEGKSGTINKTVDFRSWHCGRQGRGKFIKSQILDSSYSSFKNKSWILDDGIVEGKRRGSLNKVFDFGSWHCGRQGRKV